MADIVSRHIRHDWRTWDDSQDQKTVKTLCDVKSRPGLCGIPGVTSQSLWMKRKSDSKYALGWCWRCSRVFAATEIDSEPPPNIPPELVPVFIRAIAFADAVRMLLKHQKTLGHPRHKTPTLTAPISSYDLTFE